MGYTRKGKSPMAKKLIGGQHRLPEELKAKIKAAPEDGSPMKLKDACYYKAKRAHKVFPSAYASGMIAKCRKNKGK